MRHDGDSDSERDAGAREETSVDGRALPARGSVTLVSEIALAPGAPFATVFARVYPRLQSLHAAFPRDGLLLVAVEDGRQVVAHVHLALGDEPTSAVIGRHARCDLVATGDPALSLRHALVRASLRGGELRLRVLDLSSRSGLRTEDDLPCAALLAEGALFLRAGRHQLFFLPTGAPCAIPWSETAEETFAAFPERVYLDRRIPDQLPRPATLPPPAASAVAAGTSGRGHVSHITLLPAARPLHARPLFSYAGPQIASLVLRQRQERITFPVHELEIDRGILIGRYERCQLGAADRALSRVHLLLVRDDDTIWALDTASTNGVRQGGQRIRQTRLPSAEPLALPGDLELTWIPL